MSDSTDEKASFGNSVDRVHAEIRNRIVNGLYSPGQQLRLHEVSESLGVSLIPIREALRRLEVERLVENRPNRGARVAPISIDDLVDAYDTRMLLETEALRRAWANLDEETLTEAARNLDSMYGAFEEGRLEDGARLHRQYHFELWSRAGSQWLDHLVRMLWSHTERYRNLALVLHTPQRREDEFHTVLLQSLQGEDLDAALAHTRGELARARDVVIQHLSESAPKSVYVQIA